MRNLPISCFIFLISINPLNAKTCSPEVKVNKNEHDLLKVATFSANELKKCFQELGVMSKNVETNIDGVDQNAIALKCGPGATQKLSTQFTPEQLNSGKPIPADHPEVYVYLTKNGYLYAEYPSFYYFVKYNDGTGAIDVGTAPGNVMAVILPNGEERYIAGNGAVLQTNQLEQFSKDTFVNGTALKSKAKYIDKYKSMLSTYKLPQVVLKPTVSALSDEQTLACFQRDALHSLNQLGYKFFNFTYAFNFNQDVSDIGKYGMTDKVKLQNFKDKYGKTKEEILVDYANKLKSATPSCQQTFSEKDYRAQAEKTLASFLEGYTQVKRYLNGFSEQSN